MNEVTIRIVGDILSKEEFEEMILKIIREEIENGSIFIERKNDYPGKDE